jgi:hypothetical protein
MVTVSISDDFLASIAILPLRSLCLGLCKWKTVTQDIFDEFMPQMLFLTALSLRHPLNMSLSVRCLSSLTQLKRLDLSGGALR